MNAPASAISAAPLTLGLCGAMLTDVGAVRSHNEDSVTFVVPPVGKAGDALLVVADGMGGHAAGDVASSLATEVVRRVFLELTGPVANLLGAAFAAANTAILGYAQEHPECAGMGTTCTALGVRDGIAWLAHVGDSRAYLLRGGKLDQLSEDQTLVRKLVRDGVMTAEEAKHSENSNVLIQALGTQPEVVPEFFAEGLRLAPDDALILCSDGLHGLVDDAGIADAATRLPPLEACQELIRAAIANGGYDNVSVGIFRAVAVGEATDHPPGSTTRRIAAVSDDSRSTRQISTLETPL
jgi:protein phosphatase